MRLRSILALPPLCCLAAAASAQIALEAPPVAAAPVSADHFPATRTPFGGGVTGLPGLVYASLPGYRPLALDLYLPAADMRRPAAGFPLVIYVHGGGWLSGTSRNAGALADFPATLAALAARGYVVASLEYRLSGEARFPAPEQDVKAAIRWLRGHAADYRIDPAKAVVWGGSAGGHLAALAATTCGVAAFDPVAAPGDKALASTCVQGAVTWYGVFDFATIAAQAKAAGGTPHDVPGASEWKLLGCFAEQCRAGEIAAASPVTYVDATDPPMLLIAGTADRTVPYAQSAEMAARLKAAGVPVTLLPIAGADHSFIAATPERTRAATVQALAATVDFIDRTIGPKAPQSGVGSSR